MKQRRRERHTGGLFLNNVLDQLKGRECLCILVLCVCICAGAWLNPAQAQEEDDNSPSQTIDAPIEYKANDSIVLWGNGTAYLHGSGNIKYRTMDLTADYIRTKMDSSTIYAAGVYDSIEDEMKGLPVFKDGEQSYESRAMSYNLKSKKAYIRHVVTEQGEGYIIADRTKKMENDELMLGGGKYTTCDDHDHPHFYLQLTKAKVKPGDYIAAGPAYLVVGDVPLPLAVPFGFFPFTNKYSSGLIMPQFGDNSQRGLYLQGLGYYFALSDYADLEVTGDIYTRGTWAISGKSKYKWRYHFSGNVAINYRVDVTGEKDMPDYQRRTNFSVRWQHNQDTKANPYSTFSASVNFSTSGYNKSNVDTYFNPQVNSENTKASNISYTQRFPDSPWSLTMSANITQRTKDSTIALTLPDLSVSMSSVYPFKRKKALGKEKWYEKIKVSYSMNSRISTEMKEYQFQTTKFLRDWKTGMQHSVPLSASFTLFKYLTVTPSVNYKERWYFQRVDQSWDTTSNVLQMDTTYGFYRVWDVSTSISMQTKLYGFFIPSRKLFPNGKVDRFRHVFTPSISLNYTPDCEAIRAKIDHNYWGYYDKPVTKDGVTVYQQVKYNRFQGQMYGTPNTGNVGSLSFSLGNNLEMKVRNDKDTTGKSPYKVISLIDNLSITGGYNFMADSMNWSNFNVNLRIKLPQPLNYTINLSGQFDPYLYGLSETGTPVRTNRRCWQVGKFPHFKGTNWSFSYTFNNELFRKWINGDGKEKKQEKGKLPDFDPDDPYATNPETGEFWTEEDKAAKRKEYQDRQHAKVDTDDEGYIFTEIPWSLTINYSVRYGESNIFDYEKMNYKMKFTHNLSFSASLGLGKGWRASTSTSFDFTAKRFSSAAINITRDLHCWTMTASIVPFGLNKSYTFHIGVNASMLSDLKYDKTSAESTNPTVNWW